MACTPIEGFVVLAEHLGDDGYDVLSNFQGPFTLHPVMARALGVPGGRLRLRSPRDSGGSFGVKQAVFPYVVAMCLAARKARVPGQVGRGPARTSPCRDLGHQPGHDARSGGDRGRRNHGASLGSAR